MADRQSLSLRTDALDVIVELLGEVDAGSGFYDRLCAALCRLASMERAILMLYDDVRQLVVPVGSHGIEPGLLAEVYGTLEETPIAQVAFAEDRVVEVSGELERWVPERYARIGGVEKVEQNITVHFHSDQGDVDFTPSGLRVTGKLDFPADHPIAVLGWPAATGEPAAGRSRPPPAPGRAPG